MELGKRQARLETLYRTHAARVYSYAARRASSREDAQEVVIETFLVAWRRMEQVPDDALPWLTATARKVLSNQNRSAKRRGATATKLEQSLISTRVVVDYTGRVDEKVALLQAVEVLSEWDQEAIKLIAWEGLDNRQAAAVMGCTVAEFRVRHHRARRRLARLLERSGQYAERRRPAGEEPGMKETASEPS